MREQDIQVLEQYDIDVNSTRKTRGAVLCDTKQGLMLLKKLDVSKNRIPVLCKLCTHLRDQGFGPIDEIVENRDQNPISEAADGECYILKRWFVGKECDIKRETETLEAVRNLAKLHVTLRNIELDEEEILFTHVGEDMQSMYQRHNREMKKVRTFIRKKVEKGAFESMYLANFDKMYQVAEAAEKRLETSGYQKLLAESRQKRMLVHGDYNYHNLIMLSRGIATTNFEHFRQDVQMADLYYFMRKVLEKNQWNTVLGNRMLEAYGYIRPISQEEIEYLAISISYPEKFWKAANSYYRSNKVFVPIKSVEKLEVSIRQIEQRKRFLEQIFSFHL